MSTSPEHTRVDFSVSQSRWLADLHGIDKDLDDVVKLCETSLQLLGAVAPSGVSTGGVIDARWLAGKLSFAAVIKYGRTFGKGVRQPIPLAWIRRLPPDDQTAHQFFKALRDKYLAHSVNAFEDNQVFAVLSPDAGSSRGEIDRRGYGKGVLAVHRSSLTLADLGSHAQPVGGGSRSVRDGDRPGAG